MTLPNGDRAIIDIAKLHKYCLNPEHPRGRHKARVFARALGIDATNVDVLFSALVNAAHSAEAFPAHSDSYGQRFMVEFEVEGPRGTRRVRSFWIIRTGEETPRLATCYVA